MKRLAVVLLMLVTVSCYVLPRQPETLQKPTVYVTGGTELPAYHFSPGPNGEAYLSTEVKPGEKFSDFQKYQIERELLMNRIHYLVSVLRDMGAIFITDDSQPKTGKK